MEAIWNGIVLMTIAEYVDASSTGEAYMSQSTLAAKVGLSQQFADSWPVLRWALSITFLVLAIELLFFWAPNVKQRFWATLPGAAIGVAAAFLR